MSDKNTITGTVETYYEKDDNSPHGLVIGDTKYTTFEDDIPDITEGDEVQFEQKIVEKNGNTYHNIKEGTLEKVDTTPSGNGNSNSSNSASDGGNVFGDTDDGDAPEESAKDRRIRRQVALKASAETHKGDETADADDVLETAERYADWLK